MEGCAGHHGKCCGITSAASHTMRPSLTSTHRSATTGRAAPCEKGRSLSMDLETAIQAFGSAGNDLPQEAAEWALDHWDEVAPELLGILERFASGVDRSDE